MTGPINVIAFSILEIPRKPRLVERRHHKPSLNILWTRNLHITLSNVSYKKPPLQYICTIPMPQVSPTTLKKAALMVRDIPLPENEWTGDVLPPAVSPKQLLVVTRYEADVLCRSAARKPDQHHRYVWIMCLKGDGSVGVNTRVVTLRPGESLLILPFQTHYYMDIQRPDIQWVFVTFEHEKSAKLERLHSLGPVAVIDDAFRYFLEFVKARTSPLEEAASLLHLALVLEKLAQTKRPPKTRDTTSNRTPNGLLFTKINQFGIDHRDRIFSITEMAQHLGISESYLRSQFRYVTGRSLGLFIRELRLSHASELLHDPALRISEIALRCGYDSPFVFSRAFRKQFHCTPTEYRDRHRQNSDSDAIPSH